MTLKLVTFIFWVDLVKGENPLGILGVKGHFTWLPPARSLVCRELDFLFFIFIFIWGGGRRWWDVVFWAPCSAIIFREELELRIRGHERRIRLVRRFHVKRHRYMVVCSTWEFACSTYPLFIRTADPFTNGSGDTRKMPMTHSPGVTGGQLQHHGVPGGCLCWTVRKVMFANPPSSTWHAKRRVFVLGNFRYSHRAEQSRAEHSITGSVHTLINNPTYEDQKRILTIFNVLHYLVRSRILSVTSTHMVRIFWSINGPNNNSTLGTNIKFKMAPSPCCLGSRYTFTRCAWRWWYSLQMYQFVLLYHNIRPILFFCQHCFMKWVGTQVPNCSFQLSHPKPPECPFPVLV